MPIKIKNDLPAREILKFPIIYAIFSAVPSDLAITHSAIGFFRSPDKASAGVLSGNAASNSDTQFFLVS